MIILNILVWFFAIIAIAVSVALFISLIYEIIEILMKIYYETC